MKTYNAKLLFVGLLRQPELFQTGSTCSMILASALSEPWGAADRYCMLCPQSPSNSLHDQRPHVFGRICATWPNLSASHELFIPTELAEICGDWLAALRFSIRPLSLILSLSNFSRPSANIWFAAVWFCRQATTAIGAGRPTFFMRVAQQCFINEVHLFCPD